MDQFPVNNLGKLLIIVGGIIVLVGVVLLIAGKVPFLGRLPGDIHLKGKHMSLYFPIVTCVVLSIILTIIINLLSRR